jgi:hypothetical protein
MSGEVAITVIATGFPSKEEDDFQSGSSDQKPLTVGQAVKAAALATTIEV